LDHPTRPGVRAKKNARGRLSRLAEGHPDRVRGYQDETRWSRLAQPSVPARAADAPRRLVGQQAVKSDPDPQALACYGRWRDDTAAMGLRRVAGRPVSQVTEDFLAWACRRLAAEGEEARLLIWGNAPWHVSQRARAWGRARHRHAAEHGGVRIPPRFLPGKSPWPNAIAPEWVHGKKAIAEPERTLTAQETKGRIYAYYGAKPAKPLVQKVP
jgi:transposase